MLSLRLTLSGCASYSLRSNPVVVQTSNVAITESSDASSFYLKLTAWVRQKRYLCSLVEILNLTKLSKQSVLSLGAEAVRLGLSVGKGV